MRIAIITGASSGLGKEFATELIEKYRELDEVWLIARRKERLEEISQKYPEKTIKAVPLDLGKEESFWEFEKLLDENKPDIRILVSNAGVGTWGNFEEKDLGSQLDMLNLNAKGCVAITRLCLPYMSKGSFIIETCSVCSFVPNPRMAVYSGTKALVLYFSRAIHEELKPRGINVCALCPGNMDSEMAILSEQQGKKSIVNMLPYLDMKKVAKDSLKAAQRGRAVYTPGAFYKFYRVVSKILPHNLMMFFAD
jgi:short-subunit dehydrogenase